MIQQTDLAHGRASLRPQQRAPSRWVGPYRTLAALGPGQLAGSDEASGAVRLP